ncbi:hypothetical protein V1477_011417 [Vespula maculifrons]|uniref:Uncharacterized protein n=1 Tax=Vespula maculifrons TaxID=7453 RepID=A0ABD2BZ51_VESMC
MVCNHCGINPKNIITIEASRILDNLLELKILQLFILLYILKEPDVSFFRLIILISIEVLIFTQN